MKKAIIHDWLDLYGGAERILTAISEVYDFDYYYAYVNKMSDADLKRAFAGKKVIVEDSKFLRPVRPFFRYLMPIFPFIVKSFNKQTKSNKVDLVLSSSWILSKGYRIGNEIHICYMHSRNFKYVWDEAYLYFRGPFKALSFLKKPLQKFDIKSAQVPDHLITNSKFVQSWVKEKYNRESTVIYPPVEVDDFYISDQKEDYYITVGRIVKCKRFEIIVKAFKENGKQLIIVGDGPARKNLEKTASQNIHFVGYKTKEQLKGLLAKANAFVFAAEEDFGIAIVEALAAGLPVIAYKGGASEELINSKTGVLYDHQNHEELNYAIESYCIKKDMFDSEYIRGTALKFSKARFKEEISNYINRVSKSTN